MSTIHNSAALIADHPRKHDFVEVTAEGGATWCGVVTREIRQNSTIHSYVIQPWDHNGPMNTQVTANADDVAVHDNGRLTVMDDISKKKFNNR